MEWMRQRGQSAMRPASDLRSSRFATMGLRRRLGDPGLDPRCVRLFRARLSGGCSRRQLSRTQRRHRLDHHHHAGDAAGRRGGSGFAGRSLWTTTPADCVRALFLHHHGAYAIRSQLRSIRCAAGSLRHRHGRVLGHRRFPGHGELSQAVARALFRDHAGRILRGLSAGRRRSAHHRTRALGGGGCFFAV